jgi:hypothetical protein
MHTSVRQHLIAEEHIKHLQPQLLVELAVLFGLQPAHDTLLARLYLRPVMAISAVLGALVLRRQKLVVDTALQAASILALNESYNYAQRGRPGIASVDEDVLALLEIARTLSEDLSRPFGGIVSSARRLLAEQRSFELEPETGEARFFFD